jgi:uridylate kinase
LAYKRVVLKVSGEAMGLPDAGGLDPDRIATVARQIIEASRTGVGLGLVVGGGNFLRGAAVGGAFPRVKADQMGMLATIINGIALRETIRRLGGKAEVMAAVAIPGVVDKFDAEKACTLLDDGAAVVFAGGTGNPFFTTDTACALRCCEIEADLMLKATKVDGVYSADPVKDPSAERFDRLTYQEVLDRGLEVMDLTAVELCRNAGIPILVFDFLKEGNIIRAVQGETVGTIVS